MRLALAILAGLLFATPANATAINNPSTSTDGLVYSALAVADQWWADQGQRPCKGAAIDYDELENFDVVARGDTPGCTVYFSREYVRQLREDLRAPLGFRWHRTLYEEICMIAIHERGHNLGLDHDHGGVMLANVSDVPIVGRCKAWAVANAPRTHVRGVVGV